MLHKPLLPYFVSGLTFIVAAFPAFAEREAGEVRKKESSQPHATMFVEHDITDIELPKENDNDSPINFSADAVSANSSSKIITATGNVEITYNGMQLLTDKIEYNQTTDTIRAKGNVRLTSADKQSTIFGDDVILGNHLSTGAIKNIKVVLRDESHVFAKSFRKKSNQTKVLEEASYTPCDFCKEQKPLWSLAARKVQHKEDTKDVYYTDAFLKIKDVPVLYTPFFTHPDPTVKRRSGLLAPSFGSSNYLGAIFQPRYFWAVNDQTNVIFSPILSTDKGIIYDGSYKQYFYNSSTSISGSYLRDSEKQNNKNRGNLTASGLYDINQDWRFVYDLNYVSDYIYLKELDKPKNDDAWLASNAKFERFQGRDYASVEAFYYKTLSYNLRRENVTRYNEINTNKPYVAPLVDVEVYSDPSSIGSYFKTNLGSASVYHKDGSQTQRMTAISAWELPFTTRYGEKYRFVTSLKSDAYYVNKYKPENDYSYTGTTSRFFPQAGLEWRLPFVRANDTSRHIVEPVVVGVLAPDSKNRTDKIPNEDSADVYFDDTNVLDLDRYAGYDRNDTGSRVSYGMRWSAYDDFLGRTSAFVAQTFEKDTRAPFIESLDNTNKSHFSDIVGRINAEPNKYLNLNYRFRMDKDNLDSKYSELGASVGPDYLRLHTSYIFLEGNSYYNDLYSERKELYLSLSSALSQYWTASIYNLQDLSTQDKKSLEHGGNLIYEDECTKWITSVKKYNSSDPDLDNSYEFTFTFYLKTIGSFGS